MNQSTSKANMKLIPLIGALLISAVPAQAAGVWDGIRETCEASEATSKACFTIFVYSSSVATFKMLCSLRKAGEITPKVFAAREKYYNDARAQGDGAAWNDGIKKVLEDYPNCPIKPIR